MSILASRKFFILIFSLIGFSQIAISQMVDKPISQNIGLLKEFVPNRGQWNNEILYRSKSSDLDVHVTRQGINYFFYNPKQIEQIASHAKANEKNKIDSLLQMHLIKLEFINSNPADIEIEGTQKHYYNYFQGKDPSHWKGNIHPCKTLHYKNLFDGIDLRQAFSFSYDIVPRSEKEAAVVKEIIKKFKIHGAAKKGRVAEGAAGLFLKAPEVFRIEYMSGGRPHPYLNRFKICALHNITVNYTGSGTYATYSDATPVHMTMTLTFQELTPIYAEDYETGPGSEGTGF